MRKPLRIISSVVLLGALAFVSSAAIAQLPNPDANQLPRDNFNRFLNSHTYVASELAKNPSLVNDPKFLADHPGLQNFLATHPRIRAQVQQAPGTFTYREGRYDWIGAPIAAGAAGPHGNYLLDHQDVARAIEANPSLLDSHDYVAAHPGLAEFMEQHPNLRTEMKEHPYGFVTQRRQGYLPPPAPSQ